MKKKHKKILFPFLAVLQFSTPLMADIIRVGLDNNPQCDYDNIQEAIDNSLPGDEIRLANYNMPYFEDNILVGQHNLSIKGGYSTCSSTVPSEDARTIVHSLNEVTIFKVHTLGADPRPVVDFSNLFLRGGHTAIRLDSNAPSAVYINDSIIAGNRFAARATGPNSFLSITNSKIDSNTQGGLVCADNNSFLHISDSEISNNNATSFDSPIEILDCEVEINNSLIANNSSVDDGGAINILRGKLTLNSVIFEGNLADSDSDNNGNGGAIHAASDAEIIARSTCFKNNTAQNGGALALSGGSKYFGVRIDNENGCHKYTTNKAKAFGGAIFLEGVDTSALISGAEIKDNRANHSVVAEVLDGPNLTIKNSLVTSNGNSGQDEYNDQNLFGTGGIDEGQSIEILYTTIADNNHTDTMLTGNSLTTLNVFSSILFETGGSIYDGQAQSASFECLITHESDSLINGTDILVTDPLFKDQTNGNYFLSKNSPAIDLCSNLVPATNFDYENDSRGIDDPSIVNQNGPFDAGFDEFDYRILFRNGFELCEV